ncbi:AraC family transcriptional regulator [Paenibacillus tarimensis]
MWTLVPLLFVRRQQSCTFRLTNGTRVRKCAENRGFSADNGFSVRLGGEKSEIGAIGNKGKAQFPACCLALHVCGRPRRAAAASSLSVEQVGHRVGLPNSSYFVQLFKKAVGTTMLNTGKSM